MADEKVTQEQVEQVSRELEYAELQVRLTQANQMRMVARARESLEYGAWMGPYVDLMAEFGQETANRFSGNRMEAKELGTLAPLIRNESELATIRTPSRLLLLTNQYAMALANGISSYVVADGFSYLGSVDEPEMHPGLDQAFKNQCIDPCLEYVEWGAVGIGEGCEPSVEIEALHRCMGDGDAGIKLIPTSQGLMDLRYTEAWQLCMPPGALPQEWSFGVHTKPDDYQKALAYHISWNAGLKGEVLEPDRFKLIRNFGTYRTMKRGLPDFKFSVSDALRTANTLRGNLGEAGAQQAAIVGIEQPASGSVEEFKLAKRSKAAANVNDPYNGSTLPYLMQRRGKWITIPQGFTYANPPGANNAGAHVSILSMLLRSAVTMYNAPEWMISSEAAAQNYATSLTVNSLFVQAVKARQKHLRGAFRSIVQLMAFHRMKYLGRLSFMATDPTTGERKAFTYSWEEVLRLCRVKVSSPDPEYRDPLATTNKRQIEAQNKVLSRKEWCAQEGRDYEKVQREIREEQDANPEAEALLPAPSSDLP